MFYYFYKITNNINGKYYYGIHQTNNLDDGYMGSGVVLHHAYNKYGKQNFSKEILEFFPTYEDLREHERYIVNEHEVDNPMCYNIAIGGIGNPIYGLTDEQKENWKNKIRDAHIGKTLSDEHIEKIRLSNLGKHSSLKGKKRPNISNALKGHTPWNKGVPATQEAKEKNRQSHLNKKPSEVTKRKMSIAHTGKKKPKTSAKLLGKQKSEEHKQNIRKSKIGTHASEQAKQNMRHPHNLTKKHWKLVDGKRIYY